MSVVLTPSQMTGLAMYLAGAPADADPNDPDQRAKYLAPETSAIVEDFKAGKLSPDVLTRRILQTLGTMELRVKASELMQAADLPSIPADVLKRLGITG